MKRPTYRQANTISKYLFALLLLFRKNQISAKCMSALCCFFFQTRKFFYNLFLNARSVLFDNQQRKRNKERTKIKR